MDGDPRRASAELGVLGVDLIVARTVAAIKASTDRQTQLKGMAQTMLDQIEGINQDEVATKVLALQTSLQASYQTTSMLYQTTLTKFKAAYVSGPPKGRRRRR